MKMKRPLTNAELAGARLPRPPRGQFALPVNARKGDDGLRRSRRLIAPAPQGMIKIYYSQVTVSC